MDSFIDFYVSGGIFNHLITIGLGVAIGALISHRRAGGGARWLMVCERALVACVGLGILGVLLGMIDMCAALQSVPAEMQVAALSRAGGIVVIPLTWALLGVIPLWVVASLARFRQG